MKENRACKSERFAASKLKILTVFLDIRNLRFRCPEIHKNFEGPKIEDFGGDIMELDDIPAELKWKITIKTFQSFFSGYGTAFRQILDEKTVKNVEEIVWAERGKEVKKIAHILKLPSKNAIEVSNALKIVEAIVMGKKEHEIQDEASKLVIDHFITCPKEAYRVKSTS